MSIKQVHYDISPLLSKNAIFNIIYGEKSNGKSYQVKHLAIENYINNKKRFILLRRWREDISTLWIEQYFNDVDVKKLTNGKYSSIIVYRKVLYFANISEEGKAIKGDKIGYVMSLSTEQHMSSASFLDVNMIIFEEFMERGVYLAREPDRLMIFYNTIDRKRGETKLFMVGNTITRVNPYLYEWNLQSVIRTQKQGEIKEIIIHNEENDVKIAIEYCKSSGGKTLAIGNAKSMIDKGSWQTNPQPHLPKSRKEYEKLYQIGFQYQGFRFIAELLRDKEDRKNIAWFIYPTNQFKEKIIIFSDEINISKYWQRNIYDIDIKNDNLSRLFSTFRESNIFYSDDLCGTDFKQVIDFQIRR